MEVWDRVKTFAGSFSQLKTVLQGSLLRSTVSRDMLRGDSLSRYLSQALSSLSGPLASLTFLASMRDHYNGRYLHEGWASFGSPAEVHEMLRSTHVAVFESLLGLSVIDLARALRSHILSLAEEEARAVALWRELEPYYEMIPEGCSPLARKLFISQLQLALEVLALAPEWSCLQPPGAWPPPPPGPLYLHPYPN